MVCAESDSLASEESKTSMETEKEGEFVTNDGASTRLLSVWLTARSPLEVSLVSIRIL